MTIYVMNSEGRSVGIDENRPYYRILSIHGFFGPNDTLYNEGEIIYFEGEPNEEMEPLTPTAKTRLVAYLEVQEKLAREAAFKANRPYTGRARTLDGALVIATAIQRSEMRIMGTNRSDSQEISAVTDEGVPETSNVNPKRGRGRPRKDGGISVAD